LSDYIEFIGISKAFPGVQALKDISFRADAGRVVALLGENGAGKSTLLKILSGDISPDEGKIIIDGEDQCFVSPYHAIMKGISVIYQERQLVPTLSVIENVYSGDLPANKLGFLKKEEMRKNVQEIIDKFGLDIDPYEMVGNLSVAYQQMVEIMKAYRRDSRIVAFDEPTAPLTTAEIDILFRLIGQLKEAGKIIVYVSHRLAEIFQITDEIVVLKDGRMVSTMLTNETNEQTLIRAMVGRDIGDTYASLSRNEIMGDVLLEVDNLNTRSIHNISFNLHKGEIIGFAGLIGAGRTEVARALFGDDDVLSGEIRIEGKTQKFESPTDAINSGIALCPEDRKELGLVRFRNITDNICIPVLYKLKKGLFFDKKKAEEVAEESVIQYDIKTPSLEKTVIELSGGNQQKVILGRWTSSMMETKILILDEPTKGIDVGTKAEVYQMCCDFAKQGIGVIFISSELTEVINIADTIVVMRNGHITGTVKREEATEESVLALAMLD